MITSKQTHRNCLQAGEQSQFIVVDDENKVFRHGEGLPVKGVLNTLDQLNHSTDGQDRRLAHGLAQPQVEGEQSLDHVTHAGAK